MGAISAFTAATAVTSDDVFLGNDGSTTKKFGATVLRNGLGGVVLNAKNYGALGDGSTNDTSAIQAAITAASAAGGGIVYLPAATYMVANLYMISNVHLIGDGIDATVLKLAASQAANAVTLRASSSSTQAATNLYIADLTIDGNKGAYGSSNVDKYYGLYLGANDGLITKCVVERVRATNCKTYAFDTVGSVEITYRSCISDTNGYTTGTNNGCSGWETLGDRIRIIDCLAFGNTVYGFSVGDATVNRKDVQFVNCIARDNTSAGISVAEATRDVKILGCTVRGNGVNGITLAGLSEQIQIDSSTVEGNTSIGVQINTAKYVGISNSTIRSNTTYGIRIDTSQGNRIVGCYIGRNVTGGGGSTPEIALRGTNTTGTVIMSNRIDPAPSGGANYGVQEFTSSDNKNIVVGNVVSSGSTGTVSVLGANSVNANNVSY